jgi:hypothetical protein
VVKIELPNDPVAKIEMHGSMLFHVQKMHAEITEHSRKVELELAKVVQTRPGSNDHRKLARARKDLRLKHLCLADQERRLKERIALLNTQTGNSMAGLKAVG